MESVQFPLATTTYTYQNQHESDGRRLVVNMCACLPSRNYSSCSVNDRMLPEKTALPAWGIVSFRIDCVGAFRYVYLHPYIYPTQVVGGG